jgi:beta-alanine degradation protein BauB
MMMRFLTVALLGSVVLCAADDRVKVDNDAVRILKVVDMPHNKSALHRHEVHRVMIYLDPGDITLTYEDGHKDEQHWKAGQVAWSPAGGRHTSENVGSASVGIIEIELKKSAPPAPPVRKAPLDPVAIDPKHNVLLFENDQVRVFRSWREAGGTERMHEHPGAGRAVVLLTDLNARVKLADGTSSEQHLPAGDVLWSGPVTHAATNLAPKRFEMVVVEVK